MPPRPSKNPAPEIADELGVIALGNDRRLELYRVTWLRRDGSPVTSLQMITVTPHGRSLATRVPLNMLPAFRAVVARLSDDGAMADPVAPAELEPQRHRRIVRMPTFGKRVAP